MAEALELVKRDLGPHAVILHTRTVRKGGVLGVGTRMMVEITASNDVSALPAAERRAIIGRAEANARSPGTIRASRPMSGSRMNQAEGAAVSSTVSKTALADVSTASEISTLTAALRTEMKELRGMVRELLNRPTGGPAGGVGSGEIPEELEQTYTQLLQNAVADEIARDIIGRARRRMTEISAALSERQRAGKSGTGQEGAGLDPRQVLRDLIPAITAECIEKMLPEPGPVQLEPEGRPCCVALVGPTGVGKTTTIAKLAAHFKLREKKQVGLVTIDTYRIAAVDQLKAYADILAIPLEVVLTPAEMGSALRRMNGLDLILIDTAGRSQKNANRLCELKAFLNAARESMACGSGDPGEVDAAVQRLADGGRMSGRCEVHLVLSCASHPDQMVSVAREFAFLGLDRVVFTKVDEAVGLGVILNVIQKLDLQLSYLTTGQEVPDDIEISHRRRVAELILGRTAGSSGPNGVAASAPAISALA